MNFRQMLIGAHIGPHESGAQVIKQTESEKKLANIQNSAILPYRMHY